MQGGDRGLELVAARRPGLRLLGQCRLQDAHALGDLVPVPEVAILAVERDQAALGVEPRRQPGVVEQHQRQQAARLRLGGRERELAGEADRLAGQVYAAPVAGRVDEVEHPQHHGEVAGPVQGAPPQRPLGAADPLRHRRLRDVERVGDLTGGQAAYRAQRQRHLRGRRQRRVAAAEEQEERVVADLLPRGLGPRLGLRRHFAALPGGLAAAGVDQPPARHGRQPRARIARRLLGPGPQRLHQRLLERVLGGVEVLAPPHQSREHLRDEGAQRTLVPRRHRLAGHGPLSPRTRICRTSPRARRSTRAAARRPGRARRRCRRRSRSPARASRRRPCTSLRPGRWSPAAARRW